MLSSPSWRPAAWARQTAPGQLDYNFNVVAADCILDIRGEVCPYTYVKTRLALEEMEAGSILCVRIDYEPATRSVPRSVAIYGDEVLSVTFTQPGQWDILIRKR